MGMQKEVVQAIQDDYPEDFSWCYGCGRLNDEGYHLRTGWQGEETVTYYEPSSKAVGKVKEIHSEKWKVDVDVFMDEILCATGEVVCVVMPATFAQK